MSPIVITTGARLHFGLLAIGTAVGREFGGLGLMVDQPGYEIAFEPAASDIATGCDLASQRAAEFVARYRSAAPADRQPPPCRLDIRRAIPSHAGLGSGTQLGLAVARGLAMLAGEAPTVAELALRVGRGRRSSIGIHGFQFGGCLLEGGKGPTHSLGVLLGRADFPGDWRFVLVRPRQNAGLSGEAELSAFSQLAPMAEAVTGRLLRIAMADFLSAVKGSDFSACSDALYEYGRGVGEYFSQVQHGIYAHSEMAALADYLRQQGISGVAQTSWGPTLCVLCPSRSEAERLVAMLSHGRWQECEFRIVSALNRGAVCCAGSE